MNPLLILVPVVIGGGVLLIAGKAKAKSSSGKDTMPSGPNRQLLEHLAAAGEQISGIRDFSGFALVVALRESGWNPNAKNTTKSEAKAACRGYERNLEEGDWNDNPWKNDPARWCWGSGGWFGFLPSTALGRDGFRNLDPLSVTDPRASVAYFAAYCNSIVHGFFPKLPADRRNWLSIRMSMASLGTMYNPTGSTGKKVEARLKKNLESIGVDPSWMYSKVERFHDYPGNAGMLSAMKGVA
jgi:hypothetical protein